MRRVYVGGFTNGQNGFTWGPCSTDSVASLMRIANTVTGCASPKERKGPFSRSCKRTPAPEEAPVFAVGIQ